MMSLLMDRLGLAPSLIWKGVFGGLILLIASSPAAAQIGPNGEVETGPSNIFHRAPRELRQKLLAAEKAISEERFGDAVQLIASLIGMADANGEAPPADAVEGNDYFIPVNGANSAVKVSLKVAAQRMLGNMPAAAREILELQYGTQSRRLLEKSIAKGDMASLEEVSRKYFHTQAGYEATLLLGRYHLDGGRPLSSALTLQRLFEENAPVNKLEPEASLLLASAWAAASEPAKAKEVLLAWQKKNPAQGAGDGLPPYPGEAQALNWLAQVTGTRTVSLQATESEWKLFRGNASRTGWVSGDLPLVYRDMQVRWDVPVVNDPPAENQVRKLQRQFFEQGSVVLPQLHPLAVGSTILMRTPDHVEAVDFKSGKRIWNYSLYGQEEAFPKETSMAELNRSPIMTGAEQVQSQQLQEQIWEETPIGQMSSDGKFVYVIAQEEPSAQNRQTNMFNAFRGARIGFQQPGMPATPNVLVALELGSEGKRKWMVGGKSGEDDEQLAGAYFLGPPLPIGGQLFVLAEIKQEVRLVVIEPKTVGRKTLGRVVWSQQLAQLDGLNMGYPRRNTSATPSFADGVLICPTGQRAVVAVDLAARSLLWGYEYTPEFGAEGQFNAAQQRAIFYQQQMQRGVGNNWADSTATIAQGRVLLTMPETNELICLDLLRGDQLWKIPRNDMLYVAGVHDKSAIMVAKDRVVALQLSDGKEAWATKSISLKEFGGPSGRGFQNGRNYFLPTAHRKLLKIDLTEGRVVESVETSTVLGNLVCYRDELISQGTDLLLTFYQIEALRSRVDEALRKNPKDVWALARQGELLLRDGNADGAEKSLRAALEQTDAEDPNTSNLKNLLVTSLLTRLRADFAKESARAQDIDRLIDQPKQRADFYRLMAEGLVGLDQRRNAIDYYIRLMKMPQTPMGASFETAPPPLEDLDARWSVQRSRWIQARIGELHKSANPQEQAAINELVEAEFAKAAQDKGAASLRTFLSIFGMHPSANRARLELATRLVTGSELVEAEQLLIRLDDAGPTIAVSANALLGELLVKAQRPEEAIRWYERLAQRFADQADVKGRTAKEISETALKGLQSTVALVGDWPKGQVQVTEGNGIGDSRFAMQRGLPIQLRQTSGSVPPGLIIAYEQGGSPSLLISDGFGKGRQKIPLMTQRGPQFYSTSPSFFHGHASGHLYVTVAGLEVVAVDALRAENRREPVLWRQDLNRMVGAATPVARRISVQSMVNPWGATRAVGFDALNNQLGALGPLFEQGIYFQRVRDLVCLDPLTGTELWIRRDFDAGSEIWGDEEMLFICGPDKTEALVVNPIDGSELGKRQVPSLDRRWTTVGRLILTWTDQGTDRVLKLIDPWEANREVWSYVAPGGAKGTIVDREEVAIFHPDGKFVVLGLSDGHARVTAQLTPEPQLSEIHVLRSSRQYLLAVNTPADNTDPQTTIQPAPGGPQTIMMHGRLYAFDRANGKPLWPAPAFIDRWGLPLDQPSELPVITLMRTMTKVEVSGTRSVRSSILTIDRRDGHICFDKADIPFQINMVQIEADLAKRSVTMNIPNQKAYTLTFTDRPSPPEPPVQTGKMASREGTASSSGVAVKPLFDESGRPIDVNQPLPRRVLRPRIAPAAPFGPLPAPLEDPFGDR